MKHRTVRLILLLCALASAACLLACVGLFIATRIFDPVSLEAREPIKVNASVPDFTLRSVSGEKIQLSQYQGKQPVVLSFATTW